MVARAAAMVICQDGIRANCGATKNSRRALDKLRAAPRMRAPMHSNYQHSPARLGAAVTLTRLIPADRAGLCMRAPGAGKSDVRMR